MEENARRVKLTRCTRKKRDISMYKVAWRSCWKMKRVFDPRSITAKQFGTDFRLPFPFSRCYSSGLATFTYSFDSSVSWYPDETQKLHIYSIRRTIRRVAIRNPVGEKPDRKPAFSILVSDCIISGLTEELLPIFSATRNFFVNFAIRVGNGWEQTTTNTSRRGRGKLCPPEAVSRRDRTIIPNREILSSGRDGNFSVERRGGTVIFLSHRGTRR